MVTEDEVEEGEVDSLVLAVKDEIDQVQSPTSQPTSTWQAACGLLLHCSFAEQSCDPVGSIGSLFVPI